MMVLPRREVIRLGAGGLAVLTLAAPASRAQTGAVVDIIMQGSPRGERVWFSPQGVWVSPGTTIRWVNRDPGNSHTATAYGPNDYDRQRRIPDGVEPWDSDYLLPDESFAVTLTAPGVYDYYCLPHELSGMVGRIVVGTPDDAGWQGAAPDGDDLDPEVLAAFPAVDAILAAGRIEAADATPG